MKYSLVSLHILLLVLLLGCAQTQPDDHQRVKIAVVAVTNDLSDRIRIEDAITTRFRASGLDAYSGSKLVSQEFKISDPKFRKALLKQNVMAVLAIRPIEVGPGSSIQSAEKYLQRDQFSTIREFVAGYRGDDFATNAVVEIGGFQLLPEQTVKIWQGVVWLDGTYQNRQVAIDQLAELVLENALNWRDRLRERVGLPQLTH